MKNPKFSWLLSEGRTAQGQRWTVERLAEAIHSGRPHVTGVLNNKRDSLRTRKRLIEVFKKNFTTWRDILAALEWEEDGTRRLNAECRTQNEESGNKSTQGVAHREPRGTFHVEATGG